jgi:maltose O-acetyltransferase
VRYNASLALQPAGGAHVGADAVIRRPFFCDYGYNIRIGDSAFLNFNCVVLEVVEVVIGGWHPDRAAGADPHG